jgi:outer membrane protein assembly factor BamB
VSSNLNLTQLTSAQENKEVTINDTNAEIDAAITVKADFAIDATDTRTLTDAEFQRTNIFHLTAGGIDAAGTLTVPAVSRGVFAVVNETGFDVTITIAAQGVTPPVVPLGSAEAVLMTCDGVNVRAVAAVGGSQGVFSLSSSGHVVALSTATNFNITSFVNKGFTFKITVDETENLILTNYDVEFYAKDTFLAADLLYQVTGIDPTTGAPNWSDQLVVWLRDEDATGELHMRINNTDASNQGTFTVTIEIYQLP